MSRGLNGQLEYLRNRTRESLEMVGQGVEAPEPTLANFIRFAPLKQFPGEVQLVGPQDITFMVGGNPPFQLLQKCRGFRLINVAGSVLVDVNGGGTATVLDRDSWDFCEFSSIRLVLAAGATATFQQWSE